MLGKEYWAMQEKDACPEPKGQSEKINAPKKQNHQNAFESISAKALSAPNHPVLNRAHAVM